MTYIPNKGPMNNLYTPSCHIHLQVLSTVKLLVGNKQDIIEITKQRQFREKGKNNLNFIKYMLATNVITQSTSSLQNIDSQLNFPKTIFYPDLF